MTTAYKYYMVTLTLTVTCAGEQEEVNVQGGGVCERVFQWPNSQHILLQRGRMACNP